MPLCPPFGGLGTAFPSAGYAGILTGDAFARINTQRY